MERLIALGFGSWSTVNYVPTLGFGSSSVVPGTPPLISYTADLKYTHSATVDLPYTVSATVDFDNG